MVRTERRDQRPGLTPGRRFGSEEGLGLDYGSRGCQINLESAYSE